MSIAKNVFEITKGYQIYIEVTDECIHFETAHNVPCLYKLNDLFKSDILHVGSFSIAIKYGKGHKILDPYEFISDMRALQKVYGRYPEPKNCIELAP